MTDASPDWDELRRLAEAATPGPWSYGGMIGDVDGPLAHFVKDAKGAPVAFSVSFRADYAGLDRPFRYIAAANPATILALLDRAEKAEAEAARWQRRWTEPPPAPSQKETSS